jgi:hypothetical protein
LPGFRAAPSLGYYVVAFLGYRVERGLGFNAGGIIPDLDRTDSAAERIPAPQPRSPPHTRILTFDFVRINREKPRNPVGHGLLQRLTSDQLEARMINAESGKKAKEPCPSLAFKKR